MQLLPVMYVVLVCCAAHIVSVHSSIYQNEKLKLKLVLAGHAIGAMGAGGFASGFVTAGAAYKHHKKYHSKDGKGNHHEKHNEHKEEKPIIKEDKWHVHSHLVSHYPAITVLQNDRYVLHHDEADHHDIGVLLLHHEPMLW